MTAPLEMLGGLTGLSQAKRRVEVIKARVAVARSKVGAGSLTALGCKDYAALATDYERLVVDSELAQHSCEAAVATFDTARADAQRKSRYLAAHIAPTTAEVSRFPERLSLLGVLSVFLLLSWTIGALIIYSLKDRR